MTQEINLWAIRNRDNSLYLCTSEPYKNYQSEDRFNWFSDGVELKIDSKLFPELTFENGPLKLKLIPT